MSRAAVAREMQTMLEQLNTLNAQAEALANSSGMVDAKWFRGARTAYSMAAGQLDQQGLLDKPTAAEKAPA